MEKSTRITESTGSSSGRESLGIRFTIDYLLFKERSDSSRGQPEVQTQTADMVPHTVKEEPNQGALKERLTMGLENQEKGARRLEEENEEKDEGEQGSMSSDNPQDKPKQSYIALISMAILASKEKKLLLCEIYQWIMDHYPYFRSKDKNWRNSVRHNLSLNECFIKAGRSDNGKGHFWAIHPTNLQDFSKGDYHHRRARRRIRRVAGKISYPTPPLYHPVPCLRGTLGVPWGLPPYHCLSCIPARMYWSWASLPASHTPPFLPLM